MFDLPPHLQEPLHGIHQAANEMAGANQDARRIEDEIAYTIEYHDQTTTSGS